MSSTESTEIYPHLRGIFSAAFFLTLTLVYAAPSSAQSVETIDFGEELSADVENSTSSDDLETIDFGDKLSIDSDSHDETVEEEVVTHVEESGETQFSGEWNLQGRLDTQWQEDQDFFELMGDLKIGLQWEKNTHFSVVISSYFRYWFGIAQNPNEFNYIANGNNPKYSFLLQLDEAYINYRFDHFSLRFGNLVNSWGSTLLTQPGNVINPVDRTTILGPGASRRLPQPTIEFNAVDGPWNLQLLLVPFYQANLQWLLGRDSAILSPGNTLAVNQIPLLKFLPKLLDPQTLADQQQLLTNLGRPSPTPKNFSFGGRVTSTIKNTDVGIGYFYGWDHDPYVIINDHIREALKILDLYPFKSLDPRTLDFWIQNVVPLLTIDYKALVSKLNPKDRLIDIEIKRLHTLTVDISRFLGPIGIKADIALHPLKTFTTTQLKSIRRPIIKTALGLGWDRLFSNNALLSLNIEGFFDYILSANSRFTYIFVPHDERGSDTDNIILYPNRILAGIAFSGVTLLPFNDILLQTVIRTDLTKPDVMAWIQLSMPLYGELVGSVGAVVFHGPTLQENFSVGGLYNFDDAIYLQLSGRL